MTEALSGGIQTHRIVLIVAMSENGVIGRGGGLPWRLPDDLKHFKRVTMGHSVIMGRRTFEELGKPLPGRTNIVVTRSRSLAADGVLVAHSLDDAIECAKKQPGADRICIIGGGELFRLALPIADEMFITLVHGEVEGDAFFPDVDWSHWRLIEEQPHAADARHEFAFSFRRYERAAPEPARRAREA